jgi:hypothetical protein
MKQIYFLAIAGLFSTALSAQTLNQTQMPRPGDKFPGYVVNAPFDPGSSGTGVEWDFSSFTGDTNTFEYTAVNNDPVFTTAEEKLSLAGVGELYFKNGVNEFNLTGTYLALNGENLAVPYSDPQKLFTFPFNYGNSLSDVAKGEFNVMIGPASVKTYRTVKSTTTADGTGTVKLPGQTYNKVLRVKVVSEIKDSAYTLITGAQVVPSSMEEYYYFDENYKHQIVYMARINSPKGTIELVFYFKNTVLGNTTSETSELSPSVYPNPASNQIFVNAEAGSKVKIINGMGETVLENLSESNTSSLNISALSSGIYFYEISREGANVKTGRFVKE